MKVRRLLSILLILVLCLSFAACGANSAPMESDRYFSNEAPMEQSGALSDASTGSGSIDTPAEGRKWIVTVYMEAETESLDTMLPQLNEHIAALNGYVEDQSIYNGSSYANYRYRNANLTIRIPAEKVDAFAAQVGDISNVVSTNLTRDDITLTYVDTESRMKALQTEEARLLELLAQAETMSDLLEIEARLTDVRYELERATSQLRVYDNLVDYATIRLSISEVQEYTPAQERTVWQRIGEGFVSSLKGVGNFFLELFIFLLVASPYLAVFGGIVVGIILLIRRSAKKKKAKKTTVPPYPAQQNPQPPYPIEKKNEP
jgi:hypothetical protein